jgi:ribonuclease T1
MIENIDRAVEEQAMRRHGLIGRGADMGNMLYAINYTSLPPEAIDVIHRIANGGPFLFRQDGTLFGNRFGDLPSNGHYLEFTVPTPGVSSRGARRIVARYSGILFFTACHYERVSGAMGKLQRQELTLQRDPRWRNGFYVVTGLSLAQRTAIQSGLARRRAVQVFIPKS